MTSKPTLNLREQAASTIRAVVSYGIDRQRIWDGIPKSISRHPDFDSAAAVDALADLICTADLDISWGDFTQTERDPSKSQDIRMQVFDTLVRTKSSWTIGELVVGVAHLSHLIEDGTIPAPDDEPDPTPAVVDVVDPLGLFTAADLSAEAAEYWPTPERDLATPRQEKTADDAG